MWWLPPSPDGPIHPLPEARLSRTPRRRSPSRRSRARARTRRKARTLRTRGANRPFLAGLALLLLAVLLFPPAREAAREGWRAFQEAAAASRRETARRQEVAAYAERYGISFALAEAIHRAAKAEGVDAELAFRLVRVESEFRERAVSPVGALGLTQLMPATAAELQPGITREEILDRDTNLRLGFRYLRYLLRLYDGDVREALLAYNRGMGTIARIRAEGGDPGNGYAAKVLGKRGETPVGNSFSRGLKWSPPLHELPPVPTGF